MSVLRFVLLALLTALASAQQTISFPTEDGGKVCADLYGQGARGLVLAHGGRFNKESWRDQAHALESQGFRVLAIDFRGFGCSTGPGQADFDHAPLENDVLAAVHYLKANGCKTVSIIGGSFGGGAAGDASIKAAPGEIERIVFLGAAPNLSADKLKSRALFIVARDDGNDDGPRLPGIQAQYEKAPQPKQLIVLDGSAHAQFLFQTNRALVSCVTSCDSSPCRSVLWARHPDTVMKPTILVATWGDGLFAVTGNGRTQEFANQPVRGLAPDGRGGALAIVGGHSLLRRAPGGEWANVADTDLELSCCMAVGDAIFVGTEDARVLQLSHESGGVLNPIRGFDSIAGRDAWFAGSAIVNGQRLGPPLGIRSVAANSNGSILYANVHVGGIPRSMDGGRTWQPTIDINCDVHEVRAHPADPDLVFAAAAVGLCLSRDAGATWTIKRDGLHASYCSAVAFSGNIILVSASTDHFATQGRIYRRPVGPDGDTVVVEGLPAWTEGIVDTSCIATNGSSIAIADRAGNLYCSDDFGRAWSCESTGLPAPSSVLIS